MRKLQPVQAEMSRLIGELRKTQAGDGSWRHPFETGIITDAYMIILLRTLKMKDEALIKKLAERIESRQEHNGAWKLFRDEGEGNLSLTIDAYYALLYSGYKQRHDPNMAAARKFILSKGGIKKAGMYTKIMLAMTGQYPWPVIFPVPIEIVLLPPSCPISIYQLSSFARINLLPVILLGNKKYSLRTKNSPDLSELYGTGHREELWGEIRSDDWKKIMNTLSSLVKGLIGIPKRLRSMALEGTKQYMLQRIEPDGTLLNYFSSTYYMIFALLALGYTARDPVITKAVEGLKGMACTIDGHTHIQYTDAAVWNTALISHAIQKAGVDESDDIIQKANQYLLSRQHTRYGDWIVHNRKALPGGWGFSDLNTMHPDVDDTTASLRSFHKIALQDPVLEQSMKRGQDWVRSMQNRDGGWPAFEKNVDNQLLNLLPIQGAEFILTDPSTADLTGRTLEYLGEYTALDQTDNSIKRAIKWLRKDQERDGSWYGRWGICYLYGTWAALTGLAAAGESPDEAYIRKAVNWIKSAQNNDGGWGESCRSDIEKRYIPLGASTLTHTAWAVDALIAVSKENSPEIRKGIAFLIREGQRDDWTADYPKGQGMAGFFYMHYHSYRYIWPLLALSHYEKKFNQKGSLE
ncbi:squalene--hopene cyclase [Bacillus sp. ISL-47]|uniref:squalene--hopene cyclase n=1 Tax=Bacillus sp. ISL-47 TaxID=2819130 RepID=UPI001BE928F8|nr:squalene--hopene cyclase [Bacillus sp. ISL-47]MBT2691132.1 squalene--hopene cyclase [Bacillus sp. ISL-47]MBT2707291.1 squalene--hopene cyclase [Pseudomonas sp. ISL-84]